MTFKLSLDGIDPSLQLPPEPTDGEIIDAGSSGQWGWHATELALRCPRLFALNHRWKPAGRSSAGKAAHGHGHPSVRKWAPALIRGSLGHAGLAQHYARKMEDQLRWQTEGGEESGLTVSEFAAHRRHTYVHARPSSGVDACAREIGRESIPYIDEMKRAVAAYIEKYDRLEDGIYELEVLHAEDVFEMDIAGHRYTQRLDLAVRERGKVYIWDHKFVGHISRTLPLRYALSGQFLGLQTFGAEVWGKDFGGVKLNLIDLGAGAGGNNKPVKKGYAFERRMVDPAPAALKGFKLTVLHARERIAALDADGLPAEEWPQALSEQTCITAYGPCEAFELCRWGHGEVRHG